MTSYNSVSYTPDSYFTGDVLPPLVVTDLQIRLSGGAANTDFNASLGGAISSTEVVDNFNNNVFDDVSSGEHTAGDVEYRCLYLYNDDDTTPMNNVSVYISSDSSTSVDEWDIGLGTSGVNGTEQTIADESTAPIDVSFSHPTTDETGLSIATIPIGEHHAIWYRRTVNAGSSTVSNVNIELSYSFDET